jgi:hypothetical protein
MKSNRGKRLLRPQPVTKQAVKQILLSRQEKKILTSGITTGNAFSNTGTMIPLDTISQGDDIGQRSGDVIRHLHLHMQVVSYEPIVNTSSVWRLIVFSDTMANGAAPAVTDVLASASFIASYNPLNLQRHRFKILYDKSHIMVGGNANQEANAIVDVDLNTTRYFNDTSASSTNIGRNALFALIISSNAATCIYSRSWQLQYTDS